MFFPRIIERVLSGIGAVLTLQHNVLSKNEVLELLNETLVLTLQHNVISKNNLAYVHSPITVLTLQHNVISKNVSL